MKDGFQVSLTEGANAIKVKVTAQDTVNTETCTLTVTRNAAPTASNKTVTMDEDTEYTFTVEDFRFMDVGGDALASVQITTLERVGTLNSASWT